MSNEKPWIYIASPYTRGDVAINVRAQMEAFDAILAMGAIPIAPLFSHFQHMFKPRPYEDWIDLDLEIVKRCDACIRLEAVAERSDGTVYRQYESSGADGEVMAFARMAKPVFVSMHALEAWINGKAASPSSPVAQENKGGDMPGLRTERVVLEVTHEWMWGAAAMDWPYMLANYFHRDGESVRVVPEAEQRKEQDRYERLRLSCDKIERERDALAARVAAMQEELNKACASNSRIMAEREELLEQQQAAAEPVATEIPVEKMDAPAWRHDLRGGILALEHMLYVFREDERPSVKARMEKLRRLVEVYRDNVRPIIDAAAEPVANHSGKPDSSAEPVASRALAWGVMLPNGGGLYDHFDFEHEAAAVCESVRKVEGLEATVVPLYTAPPPAQGWLTEKESDAVSMASREIVNRMPDWGVGETVAATLDGLLIRNAPPKVVLPRQPATMDGSACYDRHVWNTAMKQVSAALAAAGVDTTGVAE